eukprot:gene29700-5134_t
MLAGTIVSALVILAALIPPTAVESAAEGLDKWCSLPGFSSTPHSASPACTPAPAWTCEGSRNPGIFSPGILGSQVLGSRGPGILGSSVQGSWGPKSWVLGVQESWDLQSRGPGVPSPGF